MGKRSVSSIGEIPLQNMRVLRLAFMLTVQETTSPGCSDLAWDEIKKREEMFTVALMFITGFI